MNRAVKMRLIRTAHFSQRRQTFAHAIPMLCIKGHDMGSSGAGIAHSKDIYTQRVGQEASWGMLRVSNGTGKISWS